MLRFLARLFSKPTPPPPPGSVPEERWQADFSSAGASRFEEADEERYAATVADGALGLRLKRGDVFAWSVADTYRYADAWVDADIQFVDGTGAGGLVVRMAADDSFMYALVSADGRIRLDAVFNGEPRPVVPWTACPWIDASRPVRLSLVMRGSRYLALVDGRWAFEADDDTLSLGRLAFAAQGYGAPAAFRLVALTVESRPIEVEVVYARWSRIVPAGDDQRRRLVESLFAAGYFRPALAQSTRLVGPLTAEDWFMRAECSLRLELRDDAAVAIDACLAANPGYDRAIEERYNILYLRGDFIRLKDALLADPVRVASSARLTNLLGHARYNLGSWAEATEAYGKASSLDPSMPIYALNQARTLDRIGSRSGAAEAWARAARGFFEQEAWDDAADCVARLRELRHDPATVDSLEGRLAYARGDSRAAIRVFARMARRGLLDAPSAYLYGMLLSSSGDRPQALAAFRTAASLEPAEPLYGFRLAEALYLSGQDCGEELARVLAMAPADGWTLNLAGLRARSSGDAAEAETRFRAAAAVLPGVPEPLVNLSDCLRAQGRLDEAIGVLSPVAEQSAAARNQLGNVLAGAGRVAEAAEAYEAAIVLASGQPGFDPAALADYRTNLAAACVELGRLADAEAQLVRALDAHPEARAYRLMGDVASMLGDVPRAEAAWRTALEAEPGDGLVLARLADQYLGLGRYRPAAEMADLLEPVDAAAAARIRETIRVRTTETMACAACGRSWTVPKPVPASNRSRMKGEPTDDSPAGSCPSCGAVYCVSCRKDALSDGRFTCPACGVNLNLNDDRIRWLVREMASQG